MTAPSTPVPPPPKPAEPPTGAPVRRRNDVSREELERAANYLSVLAHDSTEAMRTLRVMADMWAEIQDFRRFRGI